MEIQGTALGALQRAQQKLNDAGRGLIEDGPNPEDAVSLLEAKQEAKIASRVVRVADDVTESLLDILA